MKKFKPAENLGDMPQVEALKKFDQEFLNFFFPSKTKRKREIFYDSKLLDRMEENGLVSEYNELDYLADCYLRSAPSYQLVEVSKENIIKKLFKEKYTLDNLSDVFKMTELKSYNDFVLELCDERNWTMENFLKDKRASERIVFNKVKHEYSNYDTLRVVYKLLYGEEGFVLINDLASKKLVSVLPELNEVAIDKLKHINELFHHMNAIHEYLEKNFNLQKRHYKVTNLNFGQDHKDLFSFKIRMKGVAFEKWKTLFSVESKEVVVTHFNAQPLIERNSSV